VPGPDGGGDKQELISGWAKAGALTKVVQPSACPWALSRLAPEAPGVGLAPADGASERLTVRAREGKPVVEWWSGAGSDSASAGWALVRRNQSFLRAGRCPLQRQSGVWPGRRPAHGSWDRSAHPGRGSGQWLRSAHPGRGSGQRPARGVRGRARQVNRFQPDRDRLPLIRPGLCGRLHRSAGGEAGVGCSDSRPRTAPHRDRGSSQRCCRRPPDSPAGFRQS
jgi:hypothetical protein